MNNAEPPQNSLSSQDFKNLMDLYLKTEQEIEEYTMIHKSKQRQQPRQVFETTREIKTIDLTRDASETKENQREIEELSSLLQQDEIKPRKSSRRPSQQVNNQIRQQRSSLMPSENATNTTTHSKTSESTQDSEKQIQIFQTHLVERPEGLFRGSRDKMSQKFSDCIAKGRKEAKKVHKNIVRMNGNFWKFIQRGDANVFKDKFIKAVQKYGPSVSSLARQLGCREQQAKSFKLRYSQYVIAKDNPTTLELEVFQKIHHGLPLSQYRFQEREHELFCNCVRKYGMNIVKIFKKMFKNFDNARDNNNQFYRLKNHIRYFAKRIDQDPSIEDADLLPILKTFSPHETWTIVQHDQFVQAFKIYGKDFYKIADYVGTKVAPQCRQYHLTETFKKRLQLMPKNDQDFIASIQAMDDAWTKDEIKVCKDFWRVYSHTKDATRTLEWMLGFTKSNTRIQNLKKQVYKELSQNPDSDRQLWENLKITGHKGYAYMSVQENQLFLDGLEQFGTNFKLVSQYIQDGTPPYKNMKRNTSPSCVKSVYFKMRYEAKKDPSSVDPKLYDILVYDMRAQTSAINIKNAHRVNLKKWDKSRQRKIQQKANKCLSKGEALIRLLNKMDEKGKKSKKSSTDRQSIKKGESVIQFEDDKFDEVSYQVPQ